MNFVDRVLDQPRSSYLLKLSINCGCFRDQHRVNEWIRVALARQVKELILAISGGSSCSITLLPELLFSSHIVIFKLRGWRSQVPNSMCSASHMKELALYSVKLPPGDSNGEVILRCPVLENLIMCHCDHHWLKVLDIAAPRLRTLAMDNTPFGTCHCIIKISTPNLTLLDFGGCLYRDYYMENFPSLVTAKMMINSFSFKSDARLQGLVHMVEGICNVTTLQLECFDVCSHSSSIHILLGFFFLSISDYC